MPKFPHRADSAPLMMPGDAARVLGVTTKTLASMGDLTPVVLPSGHRRYPRAKVEALAARRAGRS